jgi:hypothetical protein
MKNSIYCPEVGLIVQAASSSQNFGNTSNSGTLTEMTKSHRSETSESRFVNSLLGKIEDSKEH